VTTVVSRSATFVVVGFTGTDAGAGVAGETSEGLEAATDCAGFCVTGESTFLVPPIGKTENKNNTAPESAIANKVRLSIKTPVISSIKVRDQNRQDEKGDTCKAC
jgi:hypothetical protein